MRAARRLPVWRRLVTPLPAALYLFYCIWQMPEMGLMDDSLADLYIHYNWYDLPVFYLILLLGYVIVAELSGSRAWGLAFQVSLYVVFYSIFIPALIYPIIIFSLFT